MLTARRAAVACLLVVAGCKKEPQRAPLGLAGDAGPQQAQMRATPKPPFGGSPDSVPREQFLTYAQGLIFDTLPIARDSRLMPGRGARQVGSLLTTDPEIGSHRLDSAALDSGRVVARFTASADDGVSVIGAGVSYLWVDRRYGSWRMGFVPATGAVTWRPARIVSMQSHTMNPTARPMAVAMAKWKWNSNGQWVICQSCMQLGWCETDSTTR